MDEFKNKATAFIDENTNENCSKQLSDEKPAPLTENEILVARMKTLANCMVATYARKNKDYGNSFGKSVERYGLISALTRMSDKWNRLENLILNTNGSRMVNDESLIDTLMDLATYCLMTVMTIEE